MLDLNLAAPGQPHAFRLAANDSAPFWQRRHVDSTDAHRMVAGREAELLQKAGVDWPPKHGEHINCPFPDHTDRNPSWRLLDGGRVVCTCREPHSVFDALVYLGKAKDFPEATAVAAELLGRTDLIREPRLGVTLAPLAAAKGLPVDFLKAVGCTDDRHRGAPAVRIAYQDEHGNELDPRFRCEMSGPLKIMSPKGAHTALYGRWRRDEALERGWVIIAEGESDAWTLWHRGYPAIAVPGAQNFNDKRDGDWFDGIPLVLVIREPDQGGDALLKRLATSKIAGRVRVVSLPVKDASELHLTDPERFDEILQGAFEAAQPLSAFTGNAPRNRLDLQFRDQLALNRDDEPLIDGLLKHRGLTSIVGGWGTSKTFVAIYLGLRVAQGEPFFGKETDRCAVCYIGAEAGESLVPRVLAYDDVPRDVPFAIITSSINLRDVNAPDVETLIQNIQEAERARGVKFGLIVIDTLSRAMPGGDDSKTGDMSALIANCDAIIAGAGACVAVVHHLGKDESKGSRGSSALPAAVDTEILISKRNDGTFQAVTTKQRDMPESDVMVWRLEEKVVGQTLRTNKDITSCVVVELEHEGTREKKAAKAKSLTTGQRIVLDALRKLIGDHGRQATPSNHVPREAIVASADLWRRYHEQLVPASDAAEIKARSKAFERGRDVLQSLGFVGIWGDEVWLIERRD